MFQIPPHHRRSRARLAHFQGIARATNSHRQRAMVHRKARVVLQRLSKCRSLRFTTCVAVPGCVDCRGGSLPCQQQYLYNECSNRKIKKVPATLRGLPKARAVILGSVCTWLWPRLKVNKKKIKRLPPTLTVEIYLVVEKCHLLVGSIIPVVRRIFYLHPPKAHMKMATEFLGPDQLQL